MLFREQIQAQWADSKISKKADKEKLQQMALSIQQGRSLFDESSAEALSAIDYISEDSSKHQSY